MWNRNRKIVYPTYRGLNYRALKARLALLLSKTKAPYCEHATKLYNVKYVVLCLIRHHAINLCGAMKVQSHAFLTSALDASRPGCFIPGGSPPVRYEIGQSRSGYLEEKKFLPLPGSKPRIVGRPSRSLHTISTELHQLQNPMYILVLRFLAAWILCRNFRLSKTQQVADRCNRTATCWEWRYQMLNQYNSNFRMMSI